jgi:hypothetical protein
MNTNYTLPFLTGLVTGFCIGFAALIEYIMRTREPADMPHHVTDCHTDSTPPPPADDRLDFAAITDALRKKE